MIKNFIKKAIFSYANNIEVHFVRKLKVNDVSPEIAEDILRKHSPDPGTSALWHNDAMKNDLDLTIIIPVYKVEKYLEKCLQSVINQKTSYTYNVIVVNDCSPDNSADILKKYEGVSNITILCYSLNQGVAAARNTGLREMRGRYVMFLDSDDFLPDTAVQSLVEAAYRLDADIVQDGYYDIEDVSGEIYSCKTYKYCESVAPNGVIEGMPWGKVYRSNLFYSICYPEKYWYEDTVITSLVSHIARTIVTIPDMVYYYRQNPRGIVRSGNGKAKSVDTFGVHRCVLDTREKLGLETDIDFYEHMLRMVMLIRGQPRNPKLLK